jgi:uncharacterized membrane protein
MSKHKRAWEIVQLAIIAAMFTTAAVRWGSVPDRIPIHWNAAGEVDGYGGRFAGLLLTPIVAVGVYLLLKYIPRIDPAQRNYETFAGTYLLVRVLVTAYLGFVYAVTVIAIGREAEFPTGDLLIGAVGLLFVILGGVMGKFRPNWFAGIRTPWTLTSKLSWTKTHRLGGRVFIATGLITMLGALVSSEWAFYAMFAVMIPGVVFLVAYSYFVWRDDPERVAAQDVTPTDD